ncbi:hypothetical protein LPJ63_003354 [Coemansia sp. RSA 2711]|nr:hypothetical protein LPJ63_003354 [Coemansia sp. RSA 2711]
MAEHSHDDSDYSVVDRARMTLGHAPAGLYLPGIDGATRREATRLCARDYLEHHVFFNNRGFHNHLNHHLLAVFALGAPVKRLQDIFDLHKGMQRPSYSLESDVQITADNLADYVSDERHYPNFIKFFQGELEAAGEGWKTAACNYFMDPRVFPLGMSGIFHPLIQLGYGLEFESKAITATALAQACVHSSSFKSMFSRDTVADMNPDSSDSGLSLMQILDRIRKDPLAVSMEFNPVPYSNSSITDSAEKLATKYTKYWSVPATKDAIDAKYQELLSVAALMYGSLTRPGHKLLLHFVLMHCLTSAYFLPIILDCLPVERQAEILKAHCAAVLDAFAVHGSPEFFVTPEVSTVDTHLAVSGSTGDANNQWLDVFADSIASNDIHVVKVIRSLWRGSLLSAFPVRHASGDDYELPPPINWLYLARITVDTITANNFRDMDEQVKEGKRFWTFGMLGHDEFWKSYPKE